MTHKEGNLSTQAASHHRKSLEALAASISARFIEASPVNQREVIESALAALGQFAAAEHTYLRLFAPDGATIAGSYEWHAAKRLPITDVRGLPLGRFTWLISRLSRFEPVVVPVVADLPAEAVAERQLWEKQGIQAVVVVPLVQEQRMLGYFGLAWVAAGVFSLEENLPLLELTGGLFTSLLARLRAEESLQQSETRYRIFSDISSDFLYILDVDAQGRVTPVWTNETLTRLTGFSAVELEFMSGWPTLIAEEDRRAVWEPRLARLLAGENVVSEYRLLGNDCQAIWMRDAAEPEIDPAAGRVTRIYGTASDITQNKQAEQALRASEQRYRSLMELANDGIFLLDYESGAILDANLRAQKLVGYTLDELQGKSHTCLHPPEDWVEADELRLALIRTGSSTNQASMINRQGERTHTEISASLVEVDGQRRILAIIHDLTDYMKMQSELASSEARYRAVISVQEEVICRWTPDGMITFANPAFCRVFGRDAGTVVQTPLNLPLAEGERARFLKALSSLSPVHPVDTLALSCKLQGEPRHFQWTNSAIFDESDRLVEYQSVGHDTSEEVRSAQALQQANLLLHDSIASLERRQHESNLLLQMGDLLQNCQTQEEVYAVVGQYGMLLFPDHPGALFINQPVAETLESAVVWGRGLRTQRSFSREACWAARRGHAIAVTPQSNRLHCQHLTETLPAAYACIPLMAHGESFGLLYLQSDRAAPEAFTNMGAMVAERVALALANLHLSQELRRQATHDSLTGLFNRRYMEETIARESLRSLKDELPLSLVMVEIDLFKQYNTRYRHDGGDALLVGLGRFLIQTLRAEDIACRYGGDEFVLVLPETALEQAVGIAETLRRKVKRLMVEHQGERIGAVTLSIGVAAFPDHGMTGEDVLRAADVACFQSKEAGRDRVVVAEKRPMYPPIRPES